MYQLGLFPAYRSFAELTDLLSSFPPSFLHPWKVPNTSFLSVSHFGFGVPHYALPKSLSSPAAWLPLQQELELS